MWYSYNPLPQLVICQLTMTWRRLGQPATSGPLRKPACMAGLAAAESAPAVHQQPAIGCGSKLVTSQGSNERLIGQPEARPASYWLVRSQAAA